MKTNNLLKLLVAVLLMASSLRGYAQTFTVVTGNVNKSGQTETAQYLYIAPGAVVTIDNNTNWVISSQYVFIAPTATIKLTTGSGAQNGKMILDDPGNYGPSGAARPWAGQPTTIDGGNSSITCNIVIRNPNNVVLGAVPIAPSAGAITTANTDHTLVSCLNLSFATAHGNGSAITGNDLILGNNNLHLPEMLNGALDINTISNYNMNRFVVTNGTGHIRTESVSDAYETYPVGPAEGIFSPVMLHAHIDNTAGLYISARPYVNGPEGLAAPSFGINTVWHIYAPGGNSHAYFISPQYLESIEGSSFDVNTSYVSRYVGTAPNTNGDALSQTKWQRNNHVFASNSAFTSGPENSISDASILENWNGTGIAIASSSTDNGAWFSVFSPSSAPLPVSLTYFHARAEDGCKAKLSWKTATEKNFSHFEIQRSSDGKSFESIGTLPGGKGPEYSYTTGQDIAIAYYRLKMVDQDGSVTFSSETERVANNCGANGATVTLYPNPAGNAPEVSLSYQAGAAAGKGRLLLCDVTGRVLYNAAVTVKAGANVFPIPVQGLAAGTYVVRLASDSGNWNVSPKKLTILNNR